MKKTLIESRKMKVIYQKLTMATAGVALSMGAVINATPAQAAAISYDFTATITSGTLSGKQFNGVFSYDDSSIQGTGTEWINIDSLSFELLTEYGANWWGKVKIQDGKFLGLGIAFSGEKIGGELAQNQIIFNTDKFDYTGRSRNSGDVTYKFSGDNASVPEPSIVAGLSVLGWGWFLRKKVVSSSQP